MGQVLVLAERRAAGIGRPTGALLTVARRLGEPAALLCGRADPDCLAVLARFGAATVYTVGAPEADAYPADCRVEALVALARRTSPVAVLIAADGPGREIAARLAVRLDSGLLADATDVRPGADGPVAVRAAGDRVVASSVVRGVPVITVRTETIALDPAPVEPAVHRLDVPFPASALTARVFAGRSGPADLDEAAIVVGGGHGIGSRESFALVGRLADVLGGVAGGSHTATELGWCPAEDRIDQTGHVVQPRLYVALGVSGSARHRAGMRGAETVVAVDRDPHAPILRLADLGVVGDLHQIVPELIAEIARRRACPVIAIPDPTEAQW